MARPSGLILDYGNVLGRVQDQTWMDEAARRLVADATAFRPAYGLSTADYWRRVVTAARFRAAGGRTALLSNSGPEVMARGRAEHLLEARFDRS